MNSLLSKSAMKINGLITSKAALAALLLSAFSSNAFANRPAMEENRPMMTESEAPVQTEQENIQPRPQPSMPSAVESMMQRQSQHQTGDVVQLPAKEIQPGETIKIKLLDFPRRGMSMAKVQQEFGQPIATSEGIGKPPITRWTYSDRIVYFEYSTVLHVVAR